VEPDFGGAINFCLGVTGTRIHYSSYFGSSSRTGFGSGPKLFKVGTGTATNNYGSTTLLKYI